MHLNTKPRLLLWLLAMTVALASCSSGATDESSSVATPTIEEPSVDELESLALADDTADEAIGALAQGDVGDAEPQEIEILEPVFVEAEIIEWEQGEQGELVLTIFAGGVCDPDDLSCNEGTDDPLLTVIAAAGITRFVLPVEVAPDTVESIEVSNAEFEAYLASGAHPAAIEAKPGDRYILVLDPIPESETDETDFGDQPRIASEIAAIG